MQPGHATVTPSSTIAIKRRLHKRVSSSAAAQRQPLGNNRNLASGRSKTDEQRRRYRLQATARDLLPNNKGIHQCMRRAARGVSFPTIETNGEKSRLTGVHRCKQGAICPVCAPKIAMAHAKELAAACAAAYAKGWRVLHITYTLSHHQGESLEYVLSNLSLARRKYFLAGRGYQSIKAAVGIEGSARATETTHGENGWHPHYHELLFVSGDIPDDFEETLSKRWILAVEKVGGIATPEHGLKLEEGSERISDYLNKFGRLPIEGGHSVEMELSHGYSKIARREGKTPFALLEAARGGDERSAALFVEFAAAMESKALIRWSKGLRERLEINSQDELATCGDENPFQEVAALSRAALIEISDNALLPAVLKAATAGYDVLVALLDCYEIVPHPTIDRLFIPLRDIDFVYI